jgi:choline dehydrogenase-like flavoprotein
MTGDPTAPDADTAPGVTPGEDVVADLCILGAGPAGITIARDLLGSSLTICLVESGGEVPGPDELSRGTATGEPIHPIEENTRRAFGGASHAWDIQTGAPRIGVPGPHVRHMPLDEEDFEAHAWMPNSGWPFGRAALLPHYRRAQLVCGIGAFDYTADIWEAPEARRLPLDAARLRTAMCQFGPAEVFHRLYREELRLAERTGQLRLLLNTTALRLLPQADGRAVRHLLCARPDGSQVRIAARAFVLAGGGFQNARLLLLSDSVTPGGLGNGHDVVGRYFHDHPLVFGGVFTPADPGLPARSALYDIRTVRGVPVMGYLNPAPAARRELRLSALATFLFPRPERRATHALEALRDGIRAARGKGRMPVGPVNALKLFARRPGVVLGAAGEAMRGRPVLSGFKAGGWSQQRPPGTGWRSFHVWHQVEQTPDRENRVTLGTERDRHGCRLPAVHWRWSQEDDARVARAQEMMAAAIGAAGLGRFDIARREGRTDLSYPAGAHHPMGATRMHADPRQGVVDADCRVHGVENLFVAGTSVFPTGGSANPTLTVVALALRLAAHLRCVLAPGASSPARAAVAARTDAAE